MVSTTTGNAQSAFNAPFRSDSTNKLFALLHYCIDLPDSWPSGSCHLGTPCNSGSTVWAKFVGCASRKVHIYIAIFTNTSIYCTNKLEFCTNTCISIYCNSGSAVWTTCGKKSTNIFFLLDKHKYTWSVRFTLVVHIRGIQQ